MLIETAKKYLCQIIKTTISVLTKKRILQNKTKQILFEEQ